MTAIGCASGEEPVGTGESASGAGGAPTTSASTTTTSSVTAGPGGAGGGSGGSGGSGTGGTGGTGGAVGCTDPLGSADHPIEVEPNPQTASATPLPPGATGLTGSICPVGDVDFFTVIASGGESLSVRVGSGAGGCPAGLQPLVRVVDASNQTLAEDVGFGCLELGPAAYPALAALAPGPYYVRVQNNEAMVVGAYTVDLALQPPGCGDALAQSALGEQCDDGGALNGDGCSATCQLEGAFTTELEPNDSAIEATPLGASDGAVGGLQALGDVDYYSFVVSLAGSSVSALVSDGLGACPTGFNSIVTLYDPGDIPIASDDDSGPALCSFIDPASSFGATGLPAGVYTVSVGNPNADALQDVYVLTIDVHPPGCGDAVPGAGEQCDDGNNVDGDGCTALCAAEAPWEIEPNGALAEATPVWPGQSFWKAKVKPTGDADWFSFTVPQGADVTLSTNDLGNVGACSYDTVMHLYDDQGTELAMDDEDGVNSCSSLSPASDAAVANMAAGTYYVRVKEFFDQDVIPGYELHLSIQ